MATEHLLALGRTRIGHIGGPPTWHEARERADGWRSAITEAGLEPGPFVSGNWSSASGEAAFLEMLAQAPDLDAVFAANDQMALGLLHVANERGIAVPDDVAVETVEPDPDTPVEPVAPLPEVVATAVDTVPSAPPAP